MGAMFTTLFAKIAAVVKWIGELAVAVFVALWDWIRDAFTWPFEQIMEIVVSAVQSLDLSGLTNALQGMGGLPQEITNIMGLIGVGQACAIIIAAIGIRLVLQLIPFTRLGS